MNKNQTQLEDLEKLFTEPKTIVGGRLAWKRAGAGYNIEAQIATVAGTYLALLGTYRPSADTAVSIALRYKHRYTVRKLDLPDGHKNPVYLGGQFVDGAHKHRPTPGDLNSPRYAEAVPDLRDAEGPDIALEEFCAECNIPFPSVYQRIM